MDLVDMDEWICKDLKMLWVRVKGLNTKDKILKTVTLWRKGCWRRWQEEAGVSVEEQSQIDLTIEARVAQDQPIRPLMDAVVRAQVSKAWSATFIPIIDFSSQSGFADFSPNIIDKHGQHIRIVKNAKTILGVTAVANGGVTKLTSLHIEAAASVKHHIRAYEIVSRSIPSLKYLHLSAASESANGQAFLTHYVSESSLIPFASLYSESLPDLRS
ncbi:hypothetical protein BG015_005937 [Linnemannia schmuckeri]|uniref:Uncharacterized protein n=1 Tax=Linnemannia schmuckeri TaxID=64567 RepID=A0A9P5S0C4_9FUNG|nr:hypothetical protein BG015_005937 [Linnemannia schmuckeri]